MKSSRKGGLAGRCFSGLGQLLACQGLYFAATLLLLEPILDSGIAWAVKKSGLSYLTSENILYFIRQPAAFLILFMLLLCGGLLFLFGMTITMTYSVLVKEHGKRTLKKIFSASLRQFFRIPARSFPALLLFLPGLLLFFNFPLLFWVAGRIRISRYFLSFLKKLPALEPVLALTGLLLIITAFLLLFFLPYSVLEEKKLLSAARYGFQLHKGARIKTAAAFLAWNTGLTAALAALYFLLMASGALLVRLLVERPMAPAVFLVLYERLNPLLLLMAVLITVILDTRFLSCLFFKLKEERGEEFSGTEGTKPVILLKKKLTKSAALAVLAAVLVWEVCYSYQMVRNGGSAFNQSLEYTTITSHRGYSAKAPENTMPALEAAVEGLSDAAEIDVRETKDGVVVLFHDAELYRLTGIRRRVRDLNYDELKQIDVGGWFDESFSGTSVPQLEEVLSYCKGRLDLNIELKGAGEAGSTLIEKVVALLQKFDFEKQCVITSTSYCDLETVKGLDEDLKTGYILSGGYRNFYGKRGAADFFSIKSDFITESLVRHIHTLGKEVHAWTVNSKKEMERMKELGVDSLITDKPVLAREVIYREETNKSFLEMLNMVY